jgi:microcystin degradation protein MlrC
MDRPLRIITGGIMHETNSFTPLPTAYDDFVISRDLERYADDSGQLAPLDTIDLIPTLVASAQPGGIVQRAAYERLKAEILAGIAAALPVDGLLLDLHGAMEVEGIGDGETDLIQAVRALVGDQLLIAVSLDLHGNISPELVASANILTAYRTAPHRDMRATRRRAIGLLHAAISSGTRPVAAMVKLPLVLPGEAAVTDVEPAQSLYAQLPGVSERPGVLDASIMISCAWTDSRYVGVSAIVVAESDRGLAQRQAELLAATIWERRTQFGYSVEAIDVDAAIAAAQRGAARPVYISDSGDNVTAGAPGDGALVAARLLAAGVPSALVAGIADAPAVAACAAAGVGAVVSLQIGASIDPRSGPPLGCSALVERLVGVADAHQIDTAVVRVGGVQIILTSARRAFTTRADMAACGVAPDSQLIIVVKLGYLFPDLVAHAAHAIMATTPGATTLRLETLPYQRLVRPAFPLDAAVVWPLRA